MLKQTLKLISAVISFIIMVTVFIFLDFYILGDFLGMINGVLVLLYCAYEKK